MSCRFLGLVATLAALSTVPLAGTRSTFVPDWTFKGSTLAGWHVLGAADWKAVDGELVGTPKSPDGGWLVLDKSFQDVEFGADFKCVGGCRDRRVAARREDADGNEGHLPLARRGRSRRLCRDARRQRQDLTRERLRPGGGLMRVAPSAAEAAAAAAARARRRGPRWARCAGRGAAPRRQAAADAVCCPRARRCPT